MLAVNTVLHVHSTGSSAQTRPSPPFILFTLPVAIVVIKALIGARQPVLSRTFHGAINLFASTCHIVGRAHHHHLLVDRVGFWGVDFRLGVPLNRLDGGAADPNEVPQLPVVKLEFNVGEPWRDGGRVVALHHQLNVRLGLVNGCLGPHQPDVLRLLVRLHAPFRHHNLDTKRILERADTLAFLANQDGKVQRPHLHRSFMKLRVGDGRVAFGNKVANRARTVGHTIGRPFHRHHRHWTRVIALVRRVDARSRGVLQCVERLPAGSNQHPQFLRWYLDACLDRSRRHSLLTRGRGGGCGCRFLVLLLLHGLGNHLLPFIVFGWRRCGSRCHLGWLGRRLGCRLLCRRCTLALVLILFLASRGHCHVIGLDGVWSSVRIRLLFVICTLVASGLVGVCSLLLLCLLLLLLLGRLRLCSTRVRCRFV
eukprot:m.165617 g.165617  ORF g.165617 m.165617 type:complete len:424 (+) comp12584_c0_seq1:81-1352(+)